MSPLGLLNPHVLCMQGHVCNLTKVKKNSTFISCQASEQSQPENLVASDHSCSSFRGTWTKWNTVTKDWLCYSRETQKCLPERNSRMWLANRGCWGGKKPTTKQANKGEDPPKEKRGFINMKWEATQVQGKGKSCHPTCCCTLGRHCLVQLARMFSIYTQTNKDHG